MALVGLDQPGEQLDDGRFAGAVLAEQRVHGAGLDAEADVVDRDRGAERLAQALDRDRRGAGRLSHLPSSERRADYNTRRRP